MLGTEYTIGRVPIASTDFSLETYSYDDMEDDLDLKFFALAHEDFDYKVQQKTYAKNNEVFFCRFHSSRKRLSCRRTPLEDCVYSRLPGHPPDG